MTIPIPVMDAAKLAGAVFSEEHTESCVRLARGWVLGIAHYRKQIRHIISQQVSFDLFDGAGSVLKEKRECYSFDHSEGDWKTTKQIKNVWKYQEHKTLEAGLFRIRENDGKSWPVLKFGDIDVDSSDDDNKESYWIYAVGYPRYLWKREIVKGRILSTSRDVDGDPLHATMSLERAVPGFSGGPVFSHDGKLLGVMVSNLDPTGAKNVKFTCISAISKHFAPQVGLPSLTQNY